MANYKVIFDYLGIPNGTINSNGDDLIWVPDGGTMNGLGGNDTLYGGAGNITMNGNAGNDKLFVGTGYTTMNGGDGDDQLYMYGDQGTGRIGGGTGADTFHFDFNDQRQDTIVGLEKGVDKVMLGNFDITGYATSKMDTDGYMVLGGHTVDFTDIGGASHDHGSSLAGSAADFLDVFNYLKAQGTVGVDHVSTNGANTNDDDVFLVSSNNMVINGLFGNDTFIVGSTSNGRFLGNDGVDTFNIGSGTGNQFSGGNGNDNFVFSGNIGTSRVNGNVGDDNFDIHTGAHGTSTIVGLDAGDHIMLDGVDITAWAVNEAASHSTHYFDIGAAHFILA